MTPRMVVRALTVAERQALMHGLKSADGFTVRRSQIVLPSAPGDGPAAISRAVGLTAQAVRDAIRAFHADGLGCLTRKPLVAKVPAAAWSRADDGDLKELLHRRPREFGKPTTLWTLALVADVCHDNGWAPRVLTAEGMWPVLKRLVAQTVVGTHHLDGNA